MKKIVTRKGTLENKLRSVLTGLPNPEPEISKILDAVYDFESANLTTIDKLKKKKQLDSKRIRGALRQTINAHGSITKLLIGSATKRILGALIIDEYKKGDKKYSIKSLIIGFIVGLILSGILYLL